MDLHDKQIELLRILSNNVDSPLTVRQIQEELELSSPSLVQHHIKQLEKKKYIQRNPQNPRDYKILNDPDRLVSYVNVYGFARCGPDGRLLSGDPVDRMALSQKMINFNIEDAFIVIAESDSMEPKIHDGDLVIAKKCNQPNDGEVVVCSLDNKVMIKKIHLEKMILVSLNQSYTPIIIDPNSQFYIEGVLRGVICNHELESFSK